MSEVDDKKIENIRKLWQENVFKPNDEGDSKLKEMSISTGNNDDEKMLRDIAKGVYGEELKKTMTDIVSRTRKYNTIQVNLLEMPGCEVITLNTNSSSGIDPFDLDKPKITNELIIYEDRRSY